MRRAEGTSPERSRSGGSLKPGDFSLCTIPRLSRNQYDAMKDHELFCCSVENERRLSDGKGKAHLDKNVLAGKKDLEGDCPVASHRQITLPLIYPRLGGNRLQLEGLGAHIHIQHGGFHQHRCSWQRLAVRIVQRHRKGIGPK